MASGKQVGTLLNVMPPSSSYATLTMRPGGSTPAESMPVWAFDASSDEYIDYYGVLDSYDGGGLTVTLMWAADTATSGAVMWKAAIRRLQDDAEDIDTAHSYDFNSVTDTAASAAGELSYPNITFTDGADMDSAANGEAFVLRVFRDANDAADTMTGDAHLVGVIVKES